MKELKLWQEAVALGADVTRLGRSGARRETGAFTDRLLTVAVDVGARIAAGYTHHSAPEQLARYVAARESLAELETLLAIGRAAGLMPSDGVLAASARAGGVHRLLAGYVAYLERQLEPAAPPSPAERAVACSG